MAEISAIEVKKLLDKMQGREVSLVGLRKELNILPGTKSFDGIRNIMFQLAEQKIVRPSGRKDGVYRVITQVQPVPVFGKTRERRPPFQLIFPKDQDTQMEFPFAEQIVVREGDLVLIGGVSNYGKTTLALNFCAENIDKHPILMGNEYTVVVSKKNDDGTNAGEFYEPSPRFLNRLDNMDWVEWTNGDGQDKFTLLPVRSDYAEHIVKDRINIIDWINIDTGEHYLIGTIMESIKREIGRGIAIIVLQKGEGIAAARGGQFTRDFADVELLIDKMGNSESLLTIGKVKESKIPLAGKSYAYGIFKGVKITNLREVKKCPRCWGRSVQSGTKCETCLGKGYIDKDS